MVTGDFWVLFAMLLYFIVVVIIGFIYAKKSNRSTEDYFLGGRSLGPWLTALSAEKEETERLLEEKMERWMYLNDLAEQIAEQ